MSQAIAMSTDAWHKIYEQIKLDYPSSVYLLRDRMRNTLGFTVRHHQDWDHADEYRYTVHLDFYKESLKTMFILKYHSYG